MQFSYLVGASLGRSAWFDLSHASASLLGVCQRGGSSSCKAYPPSGASELCPLVLFFFTRRVFQHLVYLLSLSYHPCPIWEISRGICSIIEGLLDCFVSPTDLERAPKWSGEIEGAFCVTWSGEYVPIFSDILILSLVWLVHPVTIFWRGSCGILLGTFVPFFKGILSFWRDWLIISSYVTGSNFPTLWNSNYFTKKVLWGDLPFYLKGFILLPSFLIFYRGGEVKV